MLKNWVKYHDIYRFLKSLLFFFIFHNIQSGKFKILFIHSFEVSYSVFFGLQDKIVQDLINCFVILYPVFCTPWIFLMVRSYVSLTSINFLNVGGVFLNEILLSYLEAGSGVGCGKILQDRILGGSDIFYTFIACE